MSLRSRKLAVSFAVVSQLVLLPCFAQDALWRSYFSSAQQAFCRGEYTSAESMLLSAQKSARRTDDELTSSYYLGRVQEQLNKLDDAEQDYKQVLDYLGPKVWAVLRPPDGTTAWDPVNSFQSDHAMDARELWTFYKKQREPLQSTLAKPISTVDVLTDLGVLMQKENRLVQAEQYFRQALMLSELRTESIPFTQPRILQRLAALYKLQNRETEANSLMIQLDELRSHSMPEFEKLVQRSLDDLNKHRHNAASATRLNNLALFCATHGDYARAESLYQRSLALSDTPYKAKASEKRVILQNYSDLLQAMGRNDDARKYLQQADKLSVLETSAPTTKTTVPSDKIDTSAQADANAK